MTASVSDEFAEAIDKSAEMLSMLHGDREFVAWLFFEYVFDAWEKESEFPDRVAFMRRAYHTRLLATGTKPTSVAAAFNAACDHTLETWPKEASDDA